MIAPRVLLARIGSEVFAFPLGEVIEVTDTPTIASLPLLPSGVAGQCVFRDRLIPVLDAGALLGARRGSGTGALLVVALGAERLGLLVDDVLDMVSMDPARLCAVPAGSVTTTVLLGLLSLDQGLAALVDMDGMRAAAVARLSTEVG